MFQSLNCVRRKDSLTGVKFKSLSVTAYIFPGHYGLSICLRLPQFFIMGDIVTRRRKKFGHKDGVHGPLRARPTMSSPSRRPFERRALSNPSQTRIWGLFHSMACGRSRVKSSPPSLSPRTSSLLDGEIPINFFLLCPLSRLFFHQSALQSGKEQKNNKEHQTITNHQLSKSVPWDAFKRNGNRRFKSLAERLTSYRSPSRTQPSATCTPAAPYSSQYALPPPLQTARCRHSSIPL